jgi:hypothetical protein
MPRSSQPTRLTVLLDRAARGRHRIRLDAVGPLAVTSLLVLALAVMAALVLRLG